MFKAIRDTQLLAKLLLSRHDCMTILEHGILSLKVDDALRLQYS